jgi:hypothetical protein
MSYPYPTINQDRQYVDMCILPHKVKDIQTYAECEAAMSSCERQAVKRYHRSGDATQAHFAAVFNKAAHDDRLVKVKAGALPGASRLGEAPSAPKHGYQYHGACKLLLSHKAKDTLWPAAAAHLEQNLEMYHSGRGPTSRPDMPTLNCHPGPNGRLVCDASNFTQTLNLQ